MKKYEILLVIIVFCVISLNCNNKSISSDYRLPSDTIISKNEITLTEKQKKILGGAKQNLIDGAEYDLTMAYYSGRLSVFPGERVIYYRVQFF